MISSNSRAEMASSRGRMYDLLASVFRTEPDRRFIDTLRGPRFAGAFASVGADLGDEFQQSPAEELHENLAIEFTRLFFGPGTHVSPHESIYAEADGEAGGLYGAKTVEVKKFIETTGLTYDESFSGLPDHISVELEFMGKLSEFESQKWTSGDEEGAKYCLSVQRMFAEKHLLQWIPAFCARVIDEARLPFYREMAKVLDEFVEYDSREISASLA